MNYLACSCPHCEQKLEFPEDGCGQVIACPNCKGDMTLPPKPEKQSFLKLLSGKISEMRQDATDKSKLKSVLMDVVADGVLTIEEIEQVRQVMSEKGLTFDDISRWRKELLRHAVEALDTHGVSLSRLAGIRSIQSFLDIPNSDIPKENARLQRCETLAQIRERGPQPIAVSNVILRKGEQAYWAQPARLYEEKIVSRRYEGGSRGVSIRVMKGVSFRVGAQRGQFVADTADVPVSEGEFIVTSQRLIFRGNSKSFDTKYEKLLDVQNHIDGIYFSETNRQKQRKVQYLQPNGDIIVEILSCLMSGNH